MQTAEAALTAIQRLGQRGLPLERVYRLLFNPELYMTAYGRLAQNAGALTPGSTPETVDGMSRVKVEAIIEELRHEQFQ